MNKDDYRYNRLINLVIGSLYDDDIILSQRNIDEIVTIAKIDKERFHKLCVILETIFPEICALEKDAYLTEYPDCSESFAVSNTSAYFNAVSTIEGDIILNFRYIEEEI